MLYRIQTDLRFENEEDAKLVWNYLKGKLAKAININKDESNEELSYVSQHQCRHDEGLPCGPAETVKVE